MSKSQRVQVQPGINRVGEGVLLDVVTVTNAHTDGITVQQFGVNVMTAPVPDRSYLADVCAVKLSRGYVKLLFGQTKIIEESELHSLLVVRMTASAARKFLETLVDPKAGENGSIEETLSRQGVVPEASFEVTQEPTATIALAANFAATAIADGDACIDFFQASAFAIAAVSRSGKLALQSVVRVNLTAGLFFRLLLQLKEADNHLPPEGETRDGNERI